MHVVRSRPRLLAVPCPQKMPPIARRASAPDLANHGPGRSSGKPDTSAADLPLHCSEEIGEIAFLATPPIPHLSVETCGAL